MDSVEFRDILVHSEQDVTAQHLSFKRWIMLQICEHFGELTHIENPTNVVLAPREFEKQRLSGIQNAFMRGSTVPGRSFAFGYCVECASNMYSDKRRALNIEQLTEHVTLRSSLRFSNAREPICPGLVCDALSNDSQDLICHR